MACPWHYTVELLLGVPLDLSKADEACRPPCTVKKGSHAHAGSPQLQLNQPPPYVDTLMEQLRLLDQQRSERMQRFEAQLRATQPQPMHSGPATQLPSSSASSSSSKGQSRTDTHRAHTTMLIVRLSRCDRAAWKLSLIR